MPSMTPVVDHCRCCRAPQCTPIRFAALATPYTMPPQVPRRECPCLVLAHDARAGTTGGAGAGATGGQQAPQEGQQVPQAGQQNCGRRRPSPCYPAAGSLRCGVLLTLLLVATVQRQTTDARAAAEIWVPGGHQCRRAWMSTPPAGGWK
jgi:hypothetical protein